MLYHIGFGCREGPEGLTVGPLSLGKEVTEDGLLQQDRYMMRTWVELAMILQGWRDEYGTSLVSLSESKLMVRRK